MAAVRRHGGQQVGDPGRQLPRCSAVRIHREDARRALHPERDHDLLEAERGASIRAAVGRVGLTGRAGRIGLCGIVGAVVGSVVVAQGPGDDRGHSEEQDHDGDDPQHQSGTPSRGWPRRSGRRGAGGAVRGGLGSDVGGLGRRRVRGRRRNRGRRLSRRRLGRGGRDVGVGEHAGRGDHGRRLLAPRSRRLGCGRGRPGVRHPGECGVEPPERVAERGQRPPRATYVVGAAVASQPGRRLVQGGARIGVPVEQRRQPGKGAQPDGVHEQVHLTEARLVLREEVVQRTTELGRIVGHPRAASDDQLTQGVVERHGAHPVRPAKPRHRSSGGLSDGRRTGRNDVRSPGLSAVRLRPPRRLWPRPRRARRWSRPR